MWKIYVVILKAKQCPQYFHNRYLFANLLDKDIVQSHGYIVSSIASAFLSKSQSLYVRFRIGKVRLFPSDDYLPYTTINLFRG